MISCPSCGAALREGAPWCTLCYADLRPPAQRPVLPTPTTAPPTAAYGPPAGDPLTQPLIDFLPPVQREAPLAAAEQAPVEAVLPGSGWPCSACGVTNSLASPRCAGCGAAFLAAAESRPSFALPLVGDISRYSRSQRLTGAVGVVLLVLLVVAVLVMALTESAPPEPEAPTPLTPTLAPTSAPTVTPTLTPTVTPTDVPGFTP